MLEVIRAAWKLYYTIYNEPHSPKQMDMVLIGETNDVHGAITLLRIEG
jgi:hypothetical protein